MPNLRLVTKNAADFATLSQENTNTLFYVGTAITNLQNDIRGRIYRAKGNQWPIIIKGTWNGQGYKCSMAALIRHNFENASTWRVQLYSDAAWTTQIYDSGTLNAFPGATLGELDWGVSPLGSGIYDAFMGQRLSVMWFTEVTALSFKITVNDSGNSATYVDISRLFLGKYISPVYNATYGMKLSWKENTAQSRSDGGTLRSDGGQPWRTLQFDLGALPEADRAAWSDVFRYAGLRKDMFISIFPGSGGELERDYQMACKFIQLPENDNFAPSYYRTTVQVEET